MQMVDGARTVAACIGAATLEFADPITLETRANFGSVAKQITAHLVVLSARKGLLSLEHSVRHYLPQFRLAEVSVLDLLRHRGGVRDAESMLSLAGLRDWDHYTSNDLLELAYRQRVFAGPTGGFLYSNTGYILLTALLESVHSSSLNIIAREMIFLPIMMSSTVFRSHPNEVIPMAASAYSRRIDDYWSHEGRPVALAGPGSMWSTLADMDRWLAYIWDQWARQPVGQLPFEMDVPYLDASPAPFSYGAGICAGNSRNGEHIRIFHAGHEHGFSAYAHLERQGRRIVGWSNRSDLRADIVCSRLTELPLSDQPTSDAELLRFMERTIDEVNQSQLTAARMIDPEDQVEIGVFRCEEVPGAVRLARSRTTADLYLWRRGVVDNLTATDATRLLFQGDGIAIELAKNSSNELTAFTLHLERAPNLRYSLFQA